jgi:hypothetical protein
MSPTMVSILSKIKLVHTNISNFVKNQFNIILTHNSNLK